MASVVLLTLAQCAHAAPILTVSDPTFAFGQALAGSELLHTFVLKNEGDQEAVIRSVTTNCGCTVAELATKRLKPGETAELKVKLATKGLNGPVARQVLIQSNDPKSQWIILKLEGTVIHRAIIVEPPQIVLSYREQGPLPAARIDVTVVTPDVLRVVGAESDSPRISCKLDPLEAAGAYRVYVQATAPFEGRLEQPSVRIVTNEPQRSVQVPVIEKVLGRVVVSPDSITLFKRGGPPVTRYVTVGPGWLEAFEIVSVTGPLPEENVTVVPLDQSTFRLELKRLPQDASLAGQAMRLRIRSSEGEETVAIPFHVVDQ